MEAWCAECCRLTALRPDGSFTLHRNRGSARCGLSGKTAPDWLATLAAAPGTLSAAWTIEKVAQYLGIHRQTAWEHLKDGGVRPVARAGRRLLYDPLDVHELAIRRQNQPGRWDRYTLTAEDARRVSDLYAQARLVNGATPLDSPARAASLELTRRLAALHQEGATFPQLDEACGARPGTIRMRLKRHGAYGSLPPSVAAYRGVTHTGGVSGRSRAASA